MWSGGGGGGRWGGQVSAVYREDERNPRNVASQPGALHPSAIGTAVVTATGCMISAAGCYWSMFALWRVGCTLRAIFGGPRGGRKNVLILGLVRLQAILLLDSSAQARGCLPPLSLALVHPNLALATSSLSFPFLSSISPSLVPCFHCIPSPQRSASLRCPR
jgi:hypothetical protein